MGRDLPAVILYERAARDDGRLWERKHNSMQEMAVMAESRRMVGKDRKAEPRGIRSAGEFRQELNHRWSSRLQTQAARSCAKSAATRLTPSGCTRTWCGFMVWRSAREARGRASRIQIRAKPDQPGGKRAPEPRLWLEPTGAQGGFELAKVFG